MDAIEQMKSHLEKMLAGSKEPATLFLGEECIEVDTGRSRGEVSISLLEADHYDNQYGVHDMLTINDESRGYRGTVRKSDFLKVLEEEAVLASEQNRILRFVAGKARRSRADWQNLNDDSRGGQHYGV